MTNPQLTYICEPQEVEAATQALNKLLATFPQCLHSAAQNEWIAANTFIHDGVLLDQREEMVSVRPMAVICFKFDKTLRIDENILYKLLSDIGITIQSKTVGEDWIRMRLSIDNHYTIKAIPEKYQRIIRDKSKNKIIFNTTCFMKDIIHLKERQRYINKKALLLSFKKKVADKKYDTQGMGIFTEKVPQHIGQLRKELNAVSETMSSEEADLILLKVEKIVDEKWISDTSALSVDAGELHKELIQDLEKIRLPRKVDMEERYRFEL